MFNKIYTSYQKFKFYRILDIDTPDQVQNQFQEKPEKVNQNSKETFLPCKIPTSIKSDVQIH